MALIAVAAALGWRSKLAEGLARDPAAAAGWGTWGFGGQSPELVEQPGGGLSARFALSPDGTRIASYGYGTIKLWDVRSGHVSGSLVGHAQSRIESLAFSADSTLLATAGADGTVAIWDLATQQRRLSISLLPGDSICGLIGVAWHPSGKWVATATNPVEHHWLHPDPNGAKVSIWDARTGGLVKTLPVPPAEYTALAFSPNGRWLVTGSNRGLGAWDWQVARSVSSGRIHGCVLHFAFSADGRWLGIGHRPDREDDDGNPSVSIVQTSSFARVKTFPSGSTHLAFRGTKPSLLFVDPAGHLLEQGMESGDRRPIMPALTRVGMFDVDRAGTTLVAFSGEDWRPAGAYNLASGEVMPALFAPQEAIWDLRLLGTRRLVVRTYDRAVLLDLTPDTPFVRVACEGGKQFGKLSIPSSDGRYLALEELMGLRVVDLETTRCVGSFPVSAGCIVGAFSWMPGQHALLVTYGAENPHDRKPPSTVRWEPLASRVTALKFPTDKWVEIHPGGLTAVTQYGEMLDCASGHTIASIHWGRNVEYSPGGRWLIGHQQDNTALVWDGRTARPVGTLRRHQGEIIGISSSEDERFLVTSDLHATYVWDLQPAASPSPQGPPEREDSPRDLSPLAILRTGRPDEGEHRVRQRFSPDGRTLLVQRDTGAVQVWDVPTGVRLGTLSFQYGGTRWFFLATDGRYDGSEDILPRIDVRVQGQVYPLTSFDRGHYSPGLLASIFEGQRPAIPPRLRALPCPSPTPALPGPGASPRE